MGWLWPIATGKSFFDTSSVIHFAFWIFLGSCFAYGKLSIPKAMVIMGVIAYAWEGFERFAEKKWPTIWLHPESWYNAWRPHMTLEGLRPDDLYYDRKPDKPSRDAKTVPDNIERHIFRETRLTAYRLKKAA